MSSTEPKAAIFLDNETIELENVLSVSFENLGTSEIALILPDESELPLAPSQTRTLGVEGYQLSGQICLRMNKTATNEAKILIIKHILKSS